MSVLIVDSSKLHQRIYSSMIEPLGQTTEVVSTANAALALLEKGGVDAVIVAMHLGDVSGQKLCEWIRANPLWAKLPVVMTTSSTCSKEVRAALEAGVTEVFLKDEVEKINDFLVSLCQQAGCQMGKLLYIEDSKSVAAVTAALLRGEGYHVDHYLSAEEGVDALGVGDYDLVLTDVVLDGGMSGFALVRKIRATEGKISTLPILAVTGFDDSARRIELLRAGANDYVAKACVDEELIARVNNLVRSKKMMDKIEHQQELLRVMAMTDQLTGLYNRHFLMGVARQRIAEALRHKQSVSLVVVDVDKFKDINDTFGHAMGDVVLAEIGKLMNDSCRKEDVAARFGGEEFVLLLAHCDIKGAHIKAESMRVALQELKPAGLDVTASFGVTALNLAQDSLVADFSKLFNEADEAVYEAKKTGRNKVVLAKCWRHDVA